MSRTSAVTAEGTREVTFLVCESGRRWCDAARRFVGPFQHAPSESLGEAGPQLSPVRCLVQAVEHAKVRAAVQDKVAAAILWEVTPDNAARVAMTIAQVGVGRPDVLQIVGLHNGGSADARALRLRLAELGVAAVAENPEDLELIARLVRRRFAAATH